MNWKTDESEDPSRFAKGDISIELMVWLSAKKKELIETSRTSALSMLYNIIVQEFIWAERISNWNLHVCATKSMVNLFAATGHNKHSKSCRLYLQFSRYQIWNRITERFTKGFWKVLSKFLVNKTSAVTFFEAIEIFYWYTRQFVYSNSYVLQILNNFTALSL